MRIMTTLLIAFALAAPAVTETPDPEALVQEVIETLESAESVRIEGKTFSSIAMGESMPAMEMEGDFTLVLAKPNRFRIEWEQRMMPGMPANTGVVWNGGDGALMYMGMTNAWFPHESDHMALAAATGVSGGAAHTIPGVFFTIEDMPSTLGMLNGFAYEGAEEVDGTPCHKISARSMISEQHTLWIEQDRPILRKLQYELGSTSKEAINEEMIEEMLAELEMEATEETRDMVRGMLEMQREMMGDISGHLGEEYIVVEINPELSDADFTFEVPEGATEHASLWESMGDMGAMFGEDGEGGSGYNDKFAVGDVAPDFEGPTQDGETIKLSDYRGKVVLIDFWATWCGPCIAVLPSLIDAYAEYHEDGFEIIGISLDDDGDALARFVEGREGMAWPNIFEGDAWGSPIGDEYGVEAIPFTLLLDGEGVIRYRDLHGARLKEAIAELLAEQAR